MQNIDLMLVIIDKEYCDFLRNYDFRVAYNNNNKELRPFVGVLFEVCNCKYFAPLSSPKKKHLTMPNKMDFMKIDYGKLGAINFNNMIPVIEHVYKMIDLGKTELKKEDSIYQNLLIDQRNWLNANKNQIKHRANRLYQNYINNKLPESMKNRCCNFPFLEKKCLEYKSR